MYQSEYKKNSKRVSKSFANRSNVSSTTPRELESYHVNQNGETKKKKSFAKQ